MVFQLFLDMGVVLHGAWIVSKSSISFMKFLSAPARTGLSHSSGKVTKNLRRLRSRARTAGPMIPFARVFSPPDLTLSLSNES